MWVVIGQMFALGGDLMNRILVSIAAIVVAAPVAVPAAAQTSDGRTVCARGADERIVEIISPGEVGEACDVRYSRDGGTNVRTPYHANNSADFCAQKAAELITELRAAGFQCTADAPALRGGAEEPPASDFVIETQREAEPQPAPTSTPSEEPAPSEAAASPAAEPAPEASAETQPTEEEPSLQDDAQVPQDDELAVLMDEILSQPVGETTEQTAEETAVRGPANLTDSISDEVADAAQPSGRATGPVGRLVGADPVADAPVENAPPADENQPLELVLEGAAPITQAAVTESLLESLPEPAAPAVSEAVAPEKVVNTTSVEQPKATPQLVRQATAPTPAAVVERSKTPTLLRRPADIVSATVRAQAAAWNEGNLDAFMDTYMRGDKLKYISGDEVVRGWSATRKRYRDRYDDPAAMGRIDFEKLDTELVTEDVAVVNGRVRHAVGEKISMADFSLVMKREEGVWRIIQDYTIPAATPAQ